MVVGIVVSSWSRVVRDGKAPLSDTDRCRAFLDIVHTDSDLSFAIVDEC
jgi:hypothetical protein